MNPAQPSSSSSLSFTSSPADTVDVLVIGAGPTGLTAAAEAARYGLSVRIVERKAQRATESKALVNHARTLEVFESMGISEQILAAGVRFRALNAYVGRGRNHTRIDLMNLPWGDTAYPFWLSIPQYDTERVLEQHLHELGVQIEWSTALQNLTQDDTQVTATLARADGTTEQVTARWLIACDGGRSTARELVNIPLKRAMNGATFVLADVKTSCDLIEDEGHTYLHPEGLLLIVPMPEPRRFRIIAHLPGVTDTASVQMDAAFFDDMVQRRAGVEFGSHDLTWTSCFKLSHGIAEGYRAGRVFLAGDAAHVHSPVGGQGLNTGVQDAHNLLWKLALAERTLAQIGRKSGLKAVENLLDSYGDERHELGAGMVGGTERATTVLTTTNPLLKLLREPLVRLAVGRDAVQARLSRGIGMLNLGYTTSPIIGGSAPGGFSAIAPGARLPNWALKDGSRLHDHLDRTRHTWVLVGGSAMAAAATTLADLPVIDVQPSDVTNGALSPSLAAAILVRPDRYIAAVGSSPTAAWQVASERLGAASAAL